MVCFIISNLIYFVIFFLDWIFFLPPVLSLFSPSHELDWFTEATGVDVSDNKLTELPALFLHSSNRSVV